VSLTQTPRFLVSADDASSMPAGMIMAELDGL
jgi:hypothetical protein